MIHHEQISIINFQHKIPGKVEDGKLYFVFRSDFLSSHRQPTLIRLHRREYL